jgi:hypothetical protein
VFGEPGADLHEAGLEGLLVVGDVVPRRHFRMAGRQFGIGGDPALCLGPLEGAFAVGVPAVVELALVLVGSFLADVVRSVDRAARPVHVERLSGLTARCMRSHRIASSARSSLRW